MEGGGRNAEVWAGEWRRKRRRRSDLWLRDSRTSVLLEAFRGAANVWSMAANDAPDDLI